MLVLCLTVIGLIKIYTRFEKITTLADNFLAFICVGYFVSKSSLTWHCELSKNQNG